MYISSEVTELIQEASSLAQNARFEYVTPELLLYVICRNPVFARAFRRTLQCPARSNLKILSSLQ